MERRLEIKSSDLRDTQYVLPKMATRFHRRIKGWHMDVFTGYLAEVKNQSQVCKPYA
jgi:hypothetical protein